MDANERFPTENYQLYVPESAQVGKPVGKIKANDDDLGINADIKYSIINSEGANTFSISADRDTKEGIISLKKVRLLYLCWIYDDRDPEVSEKQQLRLLAWKEEMMRWEKTK